MKFSNIRMEASGIRQADLVGIIGSSGVVSEVVNGKRSISKAIDVMSSGQTPEAARIARLRGSSPFSSHRRPSGYFRRNSSRNGLQIAKWKLGKP